MRITILLRVSLCGRGEKEKLKNLLRKKTKSSSQNRRILRGPFAFTNTYNKAVPRFRVVHDSNLDKRVSLQTRCFDLFKPAAVK